MGDTPRGGTAAPEADRPDRRRARDRQLSIGGVLAVLREEFPEVTISKIRFLESEGLVEPQRSPGGYRKFGAADVERLARILRMQRDHYLPLKVIREQLDADPVAGAGTGASAVAGVPHDPRIDRETLLRTAAVGEDELASWEEFGLVAPDADGLYDADAAAVARLVAELGSYGVQARHLRGLKAAADREAGLVEQVIGPLRRHRSPQTRAHAESTAERLIELSARLHTTLVRSSLRVAGN
ncbi:MerR family transcriptional regulator [Streptomyces sp. WAC 06738]|uniref:transcriptional regulator FtsR n=1 Tax=Streptomyces sp. WAC 06738 TaxID=2203210 RepID=UPI000F6EEB05|nr:MerR family transcriptional regulator [Streptomyces sp. WAC 06738]AZM44664.1 MerR family transcriptional regulator [Streptomyces sp. WAC 06738]